MSRAEELIILASEAQHALHDICDGKVDDVMRVLAMLGGHYCAHLEEKSAEEWLGLIRDHIKMARKARLQ